MIHDTPTEREQVYQAMAESVVVIPLPNKTEGFFLSGIEAMTLADWAVVPDCIASREYSFSKANISICELSAEACERAIEHALVQAESWRSCISKWHGRRICASYTPKQERQSYLSVLHRLDELW